MGALQVRYRPKTLKGFYGNEAVKSSLTDCLSKPEVPTTFLFTGPSGSGKTTLGRIIGNTLEIDPINIHVYNAASTRGIDTIREAIETAKQDPMFGGKKRIFIFEEAHQITSTAQEGLLDFLEHPPANTFLILTTTEPSSLKVTIKRRCHQYEVKPLTEGSLTNLLKKIAEKEQLSIDPTVMERIIEVANGSAGQALKIMDQISGVSVKHALEIITDIFGDTANGFQIAQTLMKSGLSPADRWKKCSELLQVITGEPEANRRIIQSYFNSVLLKKPYGDDTTAIAIRGSNFTANYYDSGKLGLLLSVYMACE